jgi:RNA polymerase-binding transcription factor DksA
MTSPAEPRTFGPAWRTLLESRWQDRLMALTELSLAYHDAAEQLPEDRQPQNKLAARQLRKLMRQAAAARRALSDTEEALTRLSSKAFGRCEQCAAAISAAKLARDPEARYCLSCSRPQPIVAKDYSAA